MTKEQFVRKQIDVWGFDYIEELFDKGYEPKLLGNGDGVKWVWMLPVKQRVLAQLNK
jgi:hypothetical protein